MSAGSGSASNFSVNLSGSTSAVNLSSGSVGSLNNFNIGGTTPGTARVTTLNTTGSTTLGSTLTVTSNSTINGILTVAGDVLFTGVGAVKVPVGSTAQRPASTNQGMIRFNTTIGEWEGYDGAEWRSIGGDADEDYGTITSAVDVFVDYGSIL
jgi:hypothetical protein